MARKWWTLTAVVAGMFMLLDVAIVNVTLPEIQKAFGASLPDLQWVIDAYALTLAALLLTTGALADRFGRRVMFAVGTAAFMAGSLLCGLATGESTTIRRRLSALPAEPARSRPRLCLAQAFTALARSHAEAAGARPEAAERPAADADDIFGPSAGRAASLLANVSAAVTAGHAWLAGLRGDAGAMAALASEARAGLGEGEWMLDPLSRLNLALADWLRGRLDDAERGFAASLTGWRAAGERGLAARACLFLGQVQRAQGRLDAALGTYLQMLEFTGRPGAPALPLAGIAYVGMAEVECQRNELDAARRHVTEGIAGCRQLSDTQTLARGLATLAWIRQAEGDAAGALEAVAEAERAGPIAAVASLLNPVPAQQARLLLAHGDVAAAARWTKERGLSPDDEPVYQREREHLVLARVLLAQDLPGPALALVERLLTAATGQDRTGSVIELRALQALALAASGDQSGAVAALDEALTLARPQGYAARATRPRPAGRAGRCPRRPARLPGPGRAGVRHGRGGRFRA